MKNIYVLPTDKPSRLWVNNLLQGKLELSKDVLLGSNTAQHIYITSDEEIKEGDWVLGDFPDKPICKVISKYGEEFTAQSSNGDKHGLSQYDSKKIILATDGDLIKAGVQAITDEFLEWFVKNPSCEAVDIKKIYLSNDGLWKEVLLPSEWEVNTKVKRLIIPKEQ